MNSPISRIRAKIIPFSLFFLAIILAGFLVFFYLDRITVFSINHFTGSRITGDSFKGNIFKGSEITGFRAEIGKTKLGVSAEKAFFNLRPGQSVKQKTLILDCDLRDANFAAATAEPGTQPDAPSVESVLVIPFSPEQKYEKIAFTVRLNKKRIEILDFSARSIDIRMEGDYVFIPDKENTLLDLKISFSPELSSTFPDDVRSGVLSVDEDGWYSTVISYQGNVLMLKALYSII